MKIFLCVTNVNPIITRDFQLSIKKNQNYRSPLLSRQGVKSVKNINTLNLKIFHYPGSKAKLNFPIEDRPKISKINIFIFSNIFNILKRRIFLLQFRI